MIKTAMRWSQRWFWFQRWSWLTIGAVFLLMATGALTGQTASPALPPGPPPVPAYATTQTEIQNMTGWQNCTVCAGIGGNGPTASVSMVQLQRYPSLSGSSAQFNIWGPTPYADGLWWNQLAPDNAATNFQYDVDFYLTNPQAAQALEFDVNQSIGNLKFIFGTQCNIQGGVWDVWNTQDSVWEPTSVACTPPAAYIWHHLTWQFSRTSTQTVFVSLTLDGVTYYVNQAYNAEPVNAQELNVAFQMDMNATATPYSVWLDNVTLSYW